MSKSAAPDKQKNQPGNTAPNTGIAGDNEQPESVNSENKSVGHASFIMRFNNQYLSARVMVK